MNLLDAIANSIDAAELEKPSTFLASPSALLTGKIAVGTTVKKSQTAVRMASVSRKPVLQFNPLPISLNPELYKNPRSSTNPNGDLRSLFAFRQLVDPVPTFSHYYSSSGASTETIYNQIVAAASVSGNNPFAAGMIAEAKKQLAENHFPDMDGTPGQWCPVYAVPEDWYDTSQNDRYKELEIDLSNQGGKDCPFTVIGGPSDLELSIGGNPMQSERLDPQTKIHSVKMKYLLVQFRRPWLNFSLFESSGWCLAGQPEGFCSSGKTDDNPGVFPLLPSAMLLSRDISIDAQWSQRNQAFLNSVKSSKRPVFLGPLALLNRQCLGSSVQVIGWISSLVPFSPKATNIPSD